MQVKIRSFTKTLFPILIVYSFIFSPTTLAVVPDVQNLGYYSGDAHVHTRLSGDPIITWFVDVKDQVADANRVGLNWTQFTEHSDVVLGRYPIFYPKAYLSDDASSK